MTTRKPLCFISNRITALPDGDLISGAASFMDVSFVDLADGSHYYYGGLLGGEWKINRFEVGNATSKSSATIADNGSYATLAAAWTDRVSLVYV